MRLGLKKGFTLIEILVVLTIISVLVTMVSIGAAQARKKARITKATAEIKDLAKAWKSYWLIYAKWPTSWGAGNPGLKTMGATEMKILMGDLSAKGDNPGLYRFMDASDPKVLSLGFKDPWGKLYKVDFTKPPSTASEDVYETTVFFPNSRRYDYEEQ